jgi:hypothetical protein
MRSQEVTVFIQRGMVGWFRWRESFTGGITQTPDDISKRYTEELHLYEPLEDETIQLLSMMVLNIVKEDSWICH